MSLATLRGHDYEVMMSLAISPDKWFVAFASKDPARSGEVMVHVWGLTPGSVEQAWTEPTIKQTYAMSLLWRSRMTDKGLYTSIAFQPVHGI